MAGETVDDVMAQLAAAEDPKFRAVNEKHGDDHGVNLTRLRAIAKQLKTQQELAQSLWNTDDTAAKLVAILICRPTKSRSRRAASTSSLHSSTIHAGKPGSSSRPAISRVRAPTATPSCSVRPAASPRQNGTNAGRPSARETMTF